MGQYKIVTPAWPYISWPGQLLTAWETAGSSSEMEGSLVLGPLAMALTSWARLKSGEELWPLVPYPPSDSGVPSLSFPPRPFTILLMEMDPDPGDCSSEMSDRLKDLDLVTLLADSVISEGFPPAILWITCCRVIELLLPELLLLKIPRMLLG